MNSKIALMIAVMMCVSLWGNSVHAETSTTDASTAPTPSPKKTTKTPWFFEHAWGDIRYTFGYWPALVIAGGAITAGALTTVDHSVATHFTNRHMGKFDTIAEWIGQPYILDPAALVVWGAGWIAHDEKVAMTGETLLEGLLFTDAMVGGLKLAFRRTRPNGGNYSFPSGHAASTFAIATSLEVLFGPKAGIPAYAVASAISFSRIDMNAHYLSDVVFGAALGSAIGWGTAHFHKLKHPNLFVAPMVGETKGLSVGGAF